MSEFKVNIKIVGLMVLHELARVNYILCSFVYVSVYMHTFANLYVVAVCFCAVARVQGQFEIIFFFSNIRTNLLSRSM